MDAFYIWSFVQYLAKNVPIRMVPYISYTSACITVFGIVLIGRTIYGIWIPLL